MEEGPQILPPPTTLDPISRPSSTSTSASANPSQQLPGISALAASNGNGSTNGNTNSNGNGTTSSPQSRPANPPPPVYTGASPAATTGGGSSNLPTCQNCSTSTTPLWRRDEFGAVLCNACGLFLKLHGRPRPISLKTDVIKSRNRVKTVRPDIAAKKKQQQAQHQQTHNFAVSADELQSTTAAQAAQAALRASHRVSNGDGGDSPISRSGTPSIYKTSLPSFIVDEAYNSTAGLTATGGPDGANGSPSNGERTSDGPQTLEQIVAHNSTLKTRVSELELIHELFRGRLSQLEQLEAAARRGQEAAGAEQDQLRSQLDAAKESENQLRAQLEDSHRRENNLKRRLDEMELELKEAKEALEKDPAPPAKKPRIEIEPSAKEEKESAAPEEVSST